MTIVRERYVKEAKVTGGGSTKNRVAEVLTFQLRYATSRPVMFKGVAHLVRILLGNKPMFSSFVGRNRQSPGINARWTAAYTLKYLDRHAQ